MHLGRACISANLVLVASWAVAERSDQKHLISIAKAAVEREVAGMPPIESHENSPARPVFVTIEVDGKIRGCRGSLIARSSSLEEEIELAARAAAEHDPRYKPLGKKELKHYLVTVTIVDRLQPLDQISNLTSDQGLVLTAGDRTGIVLPWEGKDPATRLRWAYQKAGVAANAPTRLQTLFGERFRG